MRARVLTLVVAWPLACAQILDLDMYDDAVANTSQGGGIAGASSVQSSASSGGNGGSGGMSCLECGYAVPAMGGVCPSECQDSAICTCTNNTFLLTCGPMNNCSGQTKKCPDGFNCEVSCDSPSCTGTTIDCPRDHACIVHCVGMDACVDVKVQCTNAPCQVTCDNSVYSCANVSMKCSCNTCRASCEASLPWANYPGSPKPQMDCGESCGCEPCFGAGGAGGS